jgi:carboxyl-terminal processing protease
LLTGVVLGFLIALGAYVATPHDAAPPQEIRAAVPASEKSPLTPAESAQLSEVIERVQREYVDTVSHPELVDDALRGMVSGLDPYSSYLDAEEYADLRVSTAGTYAGIGIEVSTADRALRVVRPFRDSPCGRRRNPERRSDFRHRRNSSRRRPRCRHGAHARPTRLDGEAGRDAGGADAAAGIHRGACAGRRAQRGHGEYRRRIRLCAHHGVQRYDGGRLRGEHRASSPRHARQAARFRARSAQQPGRRARIAVEVADQLLESGVIVTADGRTPAARFSMEATPGEVLPGVPVVVLVNGSTASAAEILAGALQDHHRALLLGRRTFGKGSVQTVMPLIEGRAIKLTTSRYFTPSGRSIQGHGIDPDHAFDNVDGVPLDLDDPRVRQTLGAHDAGIHAALELLKGNKPKAASGMTASAGSAPWK